MIRALTIALAAAALVAPTAAQEPEMRSSDRKRMAKDFGEWLSARLENDLPAAAEAQSEMQDRMRSIEKKLDDRSALSLVWDWQEILRSGREYEQRGSRVNEGEVKRFELSGAAYSVWLPDDYEPDDQSYPGILLFTDQDPAALMEAVEEDLRDRFIVVFPELGEVEPELVMEREGQLRMLLPVRDASVHYHVDRTRFFVAGQGDAGCAVAAHLAAVMPHFFAGLATVGAAAEPPEGAANLDLMPHAQHDTLAAAMQWAAEQEARDAYPTEFAYELTQQWQGRAYWVQATRFDLPEGETARFQVSVDRESNEIRIDSQHVYSLVLYLNDAIVDLDRTVTVVRNGEPYQWAPSRSLGMLLDNYDLDPASVYPSKLPRLDVPVPEESEESGAR